MKKQLAPDVAALRERLAMTFALGDRQAVKMRPQAALKHRRAIDDEMMRRDRAGHARRMSADDVGRLGGGDVLDHDLEPGMALEQRQRGSAP